MDKGGNNMVKIIAITNQKGGVGKTTTSVNLSAALAYLGKKVLLIDIDPQANATQGIGINRSQLDLTVYDAITQGTSMKDIVLHSDVKNLDVIPANIDLAGVEIELSQVKTGREQRLKKALKEIQDLYHYIIIDCPPSLNLLTLNAMTTADSVLVPIQCEYYALEGLSQLIHTINLVKERLNPDLEMEGVVFTMYDSRTNLSSQVVENVKDHLKQRVFSTMIPRNIRLAEAPSYGMPIHMYDSKSAGAEAYMQLANEIIGRKDD